jgi:hypothetical protein
MVARQAAAAEASSRGYSPADLGARIGSEEHLLLAPVAGNGIPYYLSH